MAKAIRSVLVLVMSLGCVASVARAQISPEEAMKRLKAKQEARQAEREKILAIKQGDLDDLKAEITKLKAQVAALQNELAAAKASGTASAQPAIKTPLAIAVGITKEELDRFIQVHHLEYEVMADLPSGEMKIAQKAKHKVFDGTFGSNGVQNFARYSEQMRPDVVLTLELVAGKVASISQMKIPAQPDEIQPIVPAHRR